MGDQRKKRTKSDPIVEQASQLRSKESTAVVVARPQSSSESNQRHHNAVQQVALDKSSVDYLSRIIQERINREFASRDQLLLAQVGKMINSAINDYSRNNPKRDEGHSFTPTKLPMIENGSLEIRSSSGDDANKVSRKSLHGKQDSKIPRIKLPKVSGAIEAKQTSARSSKNNHPAGSPSHLAERAPSARRPVNLAGKANVDEVPLDGVIYSQCRSAVSASAQDVECLKALSTEPHEFKIRPSHCFGYNGDTSKSSNSIANKNIFLIGRDHIVYPAASLIVVASLSLHRQAFFHGHSDHVTCLALNASSHVIASCQSGSDTKVRIWDYTNQVKGKSSNVCSKLGISSSVKAIGGLNFSGDGKYLLVYASEDVRSIFILDWTKNSVLCCVKSGHPDSCEVFFDPYSYLPFHEEDVSNLSPSQSYLPGCYNIISRSARQLKVWTMKSCLATEPTKSLLKNNKHMQAIEYVLESGNLHQGNKQVEFSSVICTSTHEASSYIFAGVTSGAIQVWTQLKEDTNDEPYGATWIARGQLLMVIEKAHDSGITNFDFIVNASCCKLATCDKDGVVNVWNMNTASDVSKEDLLSHADAIHIEDVGVRTLLWNEDGSKLLAGTMSNNILAMSWPTDEANTASEAAHAVHFDFLVRSHTGKIRKLALNPLRSNIVATIGTDKMVKLWDSIARRFLCHLSLEIAPTAIQFTSDGHGLVIGNEQGELVVLRSTTFSMFLTTNEMFASVSDWEVSQSKEFTSASGMIPVVCMAAVVSFIELTFVFFIFFFVAVCADKKQQKRNGVTAVSCSTDGQYIAVGCKDGSIHILSVDSNLRRIGICKGHTSQIKNIDFSRDGRYLKSSDSSHDLLHWEVASAGRFNNVAAIKAVTWESFTCLYGWGLQGIFNTNVAGQFDQDLNCVARSQDCRFLLVGSVHSNLIKHFRYPCLADAQPVEQLQGHSTAVVDMSFNLSNQIISAGGQDCTIIVWEVIPNNL